MKLNKEELLDAWRYEFKEWIPIFQCDPIELIISENRNEDYEMNRAHIFLLDNGKYAFVGESGCSWYGPEEAQIEICPDLDSANNLFNKWWSR